MDPVVWGLAALASTWLLRVLHVWVVGRAAVRTVALQQQGLSERVRWLPPGSRVSERNGDREVTMAIGTERSGGERA
ncbi:hypothetical protein A6A06_16565 [Streptomyces sp. CB02923]|nr:hypothetical protein A6A06_16565 [Streptomyces sp. CB02923]